MFMGTAAANADVTAKEVWQGILQYYSGTGATVTTESEAMAGDTLVITGAEIEAGGGDSRFSLRVPELRFRETGDGKVEVAVADTITGRISSPGGTLAAAGTGIEIVTTDLKVVVSGTAGDMTYDYRAPALVVSTMGAHVAGQEISPSVIVTMAGGSGKTRITGTTTQVIDSDAVFETTTFELAKPAANDEAGAMRTTGTFSNLRMVTGMQIPDDVDLGDLAKAIPAGYRIDVRAEFASGNVNVDITEASGTTNVQSGLADGRVVLSLSQGGMGSEIRTGASRAVVQVPALPVPAEIGLDALSMKFSMPVTTQGEAGPFTVAQRIGGLTLSDGIWAMFDPGAVLPHDPMTFALDITGTMRLADGVFASRPPGDSGRVPAEFETLSLNELKLSALGADVMGKGAARIVNDGPEPRPVGAADFEIKGLNGLFDRLVAMSLMPQDQAMGMRMMMAMFTVPTGEDSATSRIEADEAGDVRVNGQVLYKFPKP
jgi:hypothetical protein